MFVHISFCLRFQGWDLNKMSLVNGYRSVNMIFGKVIYDEVGQLLKKIILRFVRLKSLGLIITGIE